MLIAFFVTLQLATAQTPSTEIGAAATWCSNEGGRCTFTGTKVVRFGSGIRWITKTLSAPTACTVEAFGSDPWPNWGKMCFVAKETVVVAPTPPKFKLGVYEGSIAAARIKTYESFLNRPLDYINDTVVSENWDHMVGDGLRWYFAPNWTPAGLDRVVLTVPMLPTFAKYDGPSLNDADAAKALQDGANGVYDAYWVKMRQSLLASGFTGNYVRLGWEMNGNWYNWRANVNPTAWVAYWRRIVGILNADPNSKFRFVWNPTLADQAIAAEKVYPGDDVVSAIGLDVYDSDWSRYPAGSGVLEVQKQVWDKTILNGPHGLAFYDAFAKLHRKPIQIDEWGVGPGSGHMGGDNPFFIQAFYDWVANPDHNVTLVMYYDDPTLLPPTNFPNSSALLKKLFGR